MCRWSQMISGPLWLWRLDLEPGRNIPFRCCAVTSWPPAALFQGQLSTGSRMQSNSGGLAQLEEARLCRQNMPENCSPDPTLIIPHCNMHITYTYHQINALTWTCAFSSIGLMVSGCTCLDLLLEKKKNAINVECAFPQHVDV